MRGTRRNRLIDWSYLLAVSTVAQASTATAVPGQSYLNLTVQGSFQRSQDEDAKSSRTILGIEIGVPLSSYFEISAGQTVFMDKATYTNDYRDRFMRQYGIVDLPATLVRSDETYDTSANAVISVPLGLVKPSLFGGKLWRKVCSENFLADAGCRSKSDLWNAGLAISAYMTMSLRLRISYRISPSTRDDSKKTFDDQTSVGLTWEL